MTFKQFEIKTECEHLLDALCAAVEMHSCPYLNGVGACLTGCQTEPRCITSAPNQEGWLTQIEELKSAIDDELEKMKNNVGIVGDSTHQQVGGYHSVRESDVSGNYSIDRTEK